MTMTKIYIPLTENEICHLMRVATQECRNPREQARHLIRQALGLTKEPDQPVATTRGKRTPCATPNNNTAQ